MIHFHGGPVTPTDAAIALWTRRHAMVSFERTDQAALAFEICQTVRLDCGAFSKWRDGSQVDTAAYADWVRSWQHHPAFDEAIIPDAIDGDAAENDKLIARWLCGERMTGIPVWHLHEDVERLRYLVQCARGRVHPAVALGSSGQFATPGAVKWWHRMGEAMEVACDEGGATALQAARLADAVADDLCAPAACSGRQLQCRAQHRARHEVDRRLLAGDAPAACPRACRANREPRRGYPLEPSARCPAEPGAHRMMNAIDALTWCRDNRGAIRFHADKTVSVEAYGLAKRAETVGDAVTALRAQLDGGGTA